MKQLDVGPLRVTLHRTVRVSPNETSGLPPSLGEFPIYKVSDYRETCPSQWEDNAVFVAMHDKEAMWLSFSRKNSSSRYEPSAPVAVLVGAGGINALTGDKLGLKLEEDNYLVSPPQPWIDGWKDKDGTVYQFVTTQYQKGEGLTVGEQIMGAECKTGGIGIAVFEAKEPEKLIAHKSPSQFTLCGLNDDLDYADMECSYEMPLMAFESQRKSIVEMGVGKGGKINQKIYPDPHGIEVWKEEPTAAVAVYLVNAEQFSAITGHSMPTLPKYAEDYHGIWYALKDKNKGDVKGTDAFTRLKTVFANVAGVVKKENDE